MYLTLLPVGTISNSILNYLKYQIPSYFPFEKVQRERETGIPSSYDALRKQYDANAFFTISEHEDPLLMVTDVDVYIEPADFVFGHYRDNKAIVSLQRLNPAFMDREEPQTFRDRTLGEAIHQIGHIFGLSHCKRKCTMKMVHDVIDIDKRPIKLCRSCEGSVRKQFKKRTV